MIHDLTTDTDADSQSHRHQYQIFSDTAIEIGGCYGLGVGDFHHLVTVLRLRNGDNFVVAGKSCESGVGGTDSQATSNIYYGKWQAKLLLGTSKSQSPNNSSYQIINLISKWKPSFHTQLNVAFCKPVINDEIIAWSTEMGVDIIQFILTSRSFKSNAGFATISQLFSQRYERYLKLAYGSACQSGRYTVPEILAPKSFDAALSESLDDGASHLACSLLTTKPFREVSLSKRIVAWIGPEADFSESEYQALNRKTIPISLGHNRYRVPVACAAVINGVNLLVKD